MKLFMINTLNNPCFPVGIISKIGHFAEFDKTPNNLIDNSILLVLHILASYLQCILNFMSCCFQSELVRSVD